MKKVKNFWPFILITAVVLLFFLPVFKGNMPFPGDLLVNTNPYSAQSFLGYQPGGYPNKAQGPDVITEIYPWRHFSVDQLKQGAIPFWNPHNFSGNPQMADFQTAIFYPFNFLYLFLPFNFSWTFIIMLQPFLAGFFMYLFLKKGIDLEDFPSVVGAISFAFSSYMTVWMEYGNIGNTILWLPLVLLFTKYFFKKLNAINFFGLTLSLSLAILAGYIQGVFYIFILCFFYYFYLTLLSKGGFQKHKKNFLFLTALILPFLITSFQIFPTLQLFSQSTRGAYTLDQIQKNLAPFFYWITIVFPDFFGNPAARNYWIDGTYIERVMYPGAVALFFALYAILSKIKTSEKKFFLIAAAFSLIIVTNLPLIKYFYLIPIPVISTTVATREFSIFIFSLIVLGSLGIDFFLKEKKFRKKVFAIYAAFFSLVWLAVFIISKNSQDLLPKLKISEHNLILPSFFALVIIFAVLLKNKNLKISLVIIFAVLVVDLFYFFNKITPFAPKSLTYPNTPIISYVKKIAGINRYWGYGSAYIPANFQTVDGTYSPEGNDPLHISSYGELLSSSFNGELPKALPRPDANIAPGYGPDDLRLNFYRKRILDLLGVKYILHKQEVVDLWHKPDLTTFPESEYKTVGQIYPWQVYENKNAVPRFFLAGNSVLAKNKNQALSFIYNRDINLEKTVILQKSPDVLIDPVSSGKVSLLSYKPNKITFQTEASGNKLFFLSDNYYPEWKATIDGEQKEVLLADYTFRAVAVPKGKHIVEFYYDPKSFKMGLGIAALGLIVFLLSLYYVKKNKEKF